MNDTAIHTNRIDALFAEKDEHILSMYFTAGYPQANDTRRIMKALQDGGADVIEVGIPFSDPVADGPTIQKSNQQALENGMTMKLLFQQLENMRSEIDIPVLLMGYFNPVLQYGLEKFCAKCQETGVDGLILPDLPMYEYRKFYKETFQKYGLHNIYLITPQTAEARIREIDEHTEGFIYMVSSASTTGAKGELSDVQEAYFARIQMMQLKNPRLIGFGISNHETFARACRYASGAIIGSAFINLLEKSKNMESDIKDFVRRVKNA